MATKDESYTLALIQKYGIFLTVTDLAELLKVSRPVIDSLIQAGKIPAVKVGRQYRVQTRDFLKWWAENVEQTQKNILRGCLPK